MKRKHVAKSSMPVRRPKHEAVVKNLAGRVHLHGCLGDSPTCAQTYEDNCDTPEVNHLCRPCRGREAPVWDEARAPRPCCVDNTVQVTSPDKVAVHFLAGPGPWFQCSACARCHPKPITTHRKKDR